MTGVCPRSGRSPVRRKKNYLYMGMLALAAYGFFQMVRYGHGYLPLQPLADGESEARRLLKFITHYNYQCNSTLQIGNRTHWPICTDKEFGIDVDSKDTKTVYTVGHKDGFSMERLLISNYSFQSFIFTSEKLPSYIAHFNNTQYMKTTVVANDYADFSRNSYGQHTLNDLMKILGHNHIDLLKLVNTATQVNMWEVLHFMNRDNLLNRFQQVHLAMYIDKIDEDYLYSWYRALYDLFYKEGFRLYHTASSDSLCLQVTMMQSCMYYMSWVRDPGPYVFILHPPADDGTSALEEERLLNYINDHDECKYKGKLGASQSTTLRFIEAESEWPICAESPDSVFESPCTVLSFRSRRDSTFDKLVEAEGCHVHTLKPVTFGGDEITAFQIIHSEKDLKSKKLGEYHSLETVYQMLDINHVALININIPGKEWGLLSHLLDSQLLENVTQIVAHVQVPDDSLGKHSTVLRTHYSELRRLQTQGFNIVHSAEVSPTNRRSIRDMFHLGENCCFKLVFYKNWKISS